MGGLLVPMCSIGKGHCMATRSILNAIAYACDMYARGVFTHDDYVVAITFTMKGV